VLQVQSAENLIEGVAKEERSISINDESIGIIMSITIPVPVPVGAKQ